MKAELIAYTQVIPHRGISGFWNSLVYNPEVFDSDAIVEYAARVCYNSDDRIFEKPTFVQDVIQRGHLDVAEHAHFVFEIDGISVACLGQLVRHGLMSHSVQSSRYVDQSNTEFVVPDSIAALGDEVVAKYLMDCRAQLDLYKELRELGVTKGDARYVLPTSMDTRLIVSGNASMWRNFLWQRCDKAAQTEIRQVAIEVLKQLYRVAPKIFEDIYNKYGFGE